MTPPLDTPPLFITLFGPMTVLVEGEPLPPVRSRKILYLLALLILRQGRPVEREWLAGTLWPDADQSQAFANLRPALSQLRSALGPATSRLLAPSPRTLQLELSEAEVDVLAFDATIGSKQGEVRKRATELYRGPLLEGCNEDWVFQEREARKQSCLEALQWLAQEAMRRGDYTTATALLRRAVGIAPISDLAHRELMDALTKADDRNAALELYRVFSERLRRELGAPPDNETTILYRRLRQEARAAEVGGTIAAGPSPGALASLPATPSVAGHLPHPVTGLIGREDECLEASSRLRRSRLVTLVGPGGIGKTRLAIAVASEIAAEYPDGVWLVSLEALTDHQQLMGQIAQVLGVKEMPGKTVRQGLIDHLRKKQLLLVLDNCEHLLAASAQIARYLLQECGGVRLLATSREALGITGETVWAVPALAVPNLEHLPPGHATRLRVLMSYESIQLFVERAQAVQKTFALSSNNATSVAVLCSRLEGIPLAIELAAARIRVLTAEQIVERMDYHLSSSGQLGLLISGNRTTSSRHQTLRGTLDWSYALLDETERLVLRRLSVFAGGWTLEASESVCYGNGIKADQILNVLTSLVDKSLIIYSAPERVHGETGRYRLLEMVRQYAAERLQESGEAREVQERHQEWFLAMAEKAEPHLSGNEQALWLHRLDTEHDNLRLAVVSYGSGSLAAEAGIRLAGAMWWFWKVRGRYSEGRQILESALVREAEHEETKARAKVLDAAGSLALSQSDYIAARVLHEKSLVLFRQQKDQKGIASALNNLGTVANQLGEYVAAKSFFEESLAAAREADDTRGAATVLGNLGNLNRLQGNYACSRALQEESLALRRRLGDELEVALALASLGNLVRLQGDYVTACTMLEESLEIRRRLGDRAGIAYTLSHLGNLATVQGDFASARMLFEESLDIRRALGEKRSIAWSLSNLGNICFREGKFRNARELFEESLLLFRELGTRGSIAWALNNMGNLAQVESDFASARALYGESLTIFWELHDKEGIANNLESLADVYAALGKEGFAARFWGGAEELRQSIGISIPFVEREKYNLKVERVREALGDDAFTVAWERGRRLCQKRDILQP